MTGFTPIESSLGGLMIGAAAALLLLGIGRFAGISGIVGSVLERDLGAGGWRLAFVVGLPLGAWLMHAARPGYTIEIAATPVLLVVAGLLVGFGTQLGGGCTSGHGVCGMARGSARSIVATLVFMTTGVVTVALLRHVFGVIG